MMKRLKRYTDEINRSELDPHSNLRESDWKCGLNSSSMSIMGFFVVIMMILSVMFSISVILKDPPSDGVSESLEVRVLQVNSQIGMKEEPSNAIKEPANKLLDSLLSDRIDAKSCLSRYHPLSHLKDLIHRPSPYLIAKLRNYESLHKRCGPYTESYNKTLDHLRSNHDRGSSSDCNYLVWISFSGLGNRILTLASAFLYALLTNRVLLVDPGTDMPDLFCEPFPEVSWFLPLDFPLKDQFNSFNQQSPQCYGKIIKNNINITNNPNEAFIMRPSFVYLHLVHDYDDQDKLFFCDQEQSLLQKVPWLVMKTDNYFIPSLFLIPSFEDELNNLFPNKETVFHFLGRYLFHPTNSVWGLITRYYYTYLANADEKMGIQIRVFDTGPGPFQHVLDQILACTFTEKLLPKITKTQHIITSLSKTRKTKAVLMTSLSSGYFEKVRDLFWEQATVNGEVVGIFQPSHEEHQQTQKANHNQKAWAEMYLLSLTDMLVTSSWSTFGYVAQGLGGLKPWILYKPENRTAPDPPCRRAMSMEPCFHAPPFYDCKAKRGIDTGEVVPHVRHCEDMSWGLKLVDQ